MKNGKLQVAVVGCGGIANQKHFPALKSQSDKCDIAAFCDIQVERAKKAAEEYGAEGAKVYEDYQELLKDPEIDVVHVCTPNVAHCPITVAAFEAGKHVMCEKPMAATTEDAQKMMEAWIKCTSWPAFSHSISAVFTITSVLPIFRPKEIPNTFFFFIFCLLYAIVTSRSRIPSKGTGIYAVLVATVSFTLWVPAQRPPSCSTRIYSGSPYSHL